MIPLTLFAILGVMWGAVCRGQDPDDPVQYLRTIIDNQYKIIQYINELEDKMTTISNDHQKKLTSMEESVKVIGDQVENHQNQLDLIEVSLKECRGHLEQQYDSFSSQQCLSGDQMAGFLGILQYDECASGEHNCSERAVCSDLFYSFRCSCLPGYSGDGFTCQDIDECATNDVICGGGGTCLNLPGDYSCTCPSGFRNKNKSCIDVDECETNATICGDGGTCINYPGTYGCSCREGFREDSSFCIDIDECQEGVDECQTDAKCVNTIGSYDCKCPQGYIQNGYGCVATICKPPGVLIPEDGLGCVVSLLNSTTWEKSQLNCLKLKGRLLEGITLRNLPIIKRHFPVFHSTNGPWIGINGGKWISTNEDVALELWEDGEPDSSDSCGNVFLVNNPPRIWDDYCTNKRYALCQILN